MSGKEQGEVVSSETAGQRELQQAGEDDGKGVPSFDWSETELRAYLVNIWKQKDPSRITVIGRLRIADGGSFAFLEDLHHPELGTRLPPPVAGYAGSPAVFVPPAELRAYRASERAESFAFAEIELSPLDLRKRRDDALA